MFDVAVAGPLAGLVIAIPALPIGPQGSQVLPPTNDITPISTRRRWIGYATYLILAMIPIPLPHTFWQATEIYCPYLWAG